MLSEFRRGTLGGLSAREPQEEQALIPLSMSGLATSEKRYFTFQPQRNHYSDDEACGISRNGKTADCTWRSPSLEYRIPAADLRVA